MINQGVNAALAARDSTRNGTDSHSSGTGHREGVVELTQCYGKNERLSSNKQLSDGENHVLNVAYSMTWVDLRKKMTDKYCPRNEMKKLEAELWNLKVIGTDVVKYNQRFQELALLCGGCSLGRQTKRKTRVSTSITTVPVGRKTNRNKKGSLKNTSQAIRINNNSQTRGRTTGRAIHAMDIDIETIDGGSRPLCPNMQITTMMVPCAPKCYKCNKLQSTSPVTVRGTGNTNNNNQKWHRIRSETYLFLSVEFREQSHKDFPRLKNNKGNRGNQAGEMTELQQRYDVENCVVQTQTMSLADDDGEGEDEDVVGGAVVFGYRDVTVC
ncbi:reverse transcriptase domain-containing protein [Tanacetum coccineum]|uniref:Reverse transcriptase domain-containing protein n=1 Tax=Tanacetum coccineum TaxID=301880 RepID=A0ABQ4YN58_9ASTR